MTPKDLLIQEQRREIERLCRIIKLLVLDANPCRFCVNDCDKGRGCQFFKIKEGV